MNAGDIGRDGLELAANFFGRVRLHVESVQVRGAAALPDQDARDILGATGPQHSIQGDAQRAERSQTQQVAASEQIGVIVHFML